MNYIKFGQFFYEMQYLWAILLWITFPLVSPCLNYITFEESLFKFYYLWAILVEITLTLGDTCLSCISYGQSFSEMHYLWAILVWIAFNLSAATLVFIINHCFSRASEYLFFKEYDFLNVNFVHCKKISNFDIKKYKYCSSINTSFCVS